MVTDVIVIGAGPAGTAAAREIAQTGHEVLVLEKNGFPVKKKICLCVVPRNCFMNFKLPEKIIEKECSELVYHFPEEEYHVSKTPGFVFLNRSTFEQLMMHRAEEKGAKFRYSSLVSDAVKCDDGIVIRHKRSATGEIQEERARLVIFANGSSTLAYRKFQVGFDRRPTSTAMGAAYELKYPKNALHSMDFFFSSQISPFGYGWIFPRTNTINVGVVCLVSKLKHEIRWYLDNFVALAGLGSLEVVNFNSRLVPQSCGKKLHGNSLLVVGDAAGTADPIDGGGIFNAVVSGQVAGKVAVEALEEDDVTADFLSRYEAEWKKTENFKLFRRNYLLQRLALKANVNIGDFLKRTGFLKR